MINEQNAWFDKIEGIKMQATNNPLPYDKILNWIKLKQIADDISKCIWNEK